MNSPASVRRVYILLVIGSKHSLLPKICDVLAVGIGATRRELRTPYFTTCLRNLFQSYKACDGTYKSESGTTFHKSC